MSPVDPPRKARRRLRFLPRFTIAALLVLITLIAIPLGYVAQRRAWNVKRKESHRELSQRAVQLYFGPGFVKTPPPVSPKPGVLAWLKRSWRAILLDDDRFIVRMVDISDGNGPSDGPVTDEQFALLSHFPEIEEIAIRSSVGVTDGGLATIAKLPRLRRLQLFDARKVGGAFISKISDHPALERIQLEQLPALTAEGLSDLARLKKLRQLEVVACSRVNDLSLQGESLPGQLTSLKLHKLAITDETLFQWIKACKLEALDLDLPIQSGICDALREQTALKKLAITNAPLNDQDLQCLSSLQSLEELKLTGMPLSGSFLKSLKAEQTLKRLDLSSTPLLDEFVPEMTRFRNLQMVNLAWTTLDGSCFERTLEWPAAEGFHLTGAEFSPQGKAAIATIRGPKVVGLPWNWSPGDCVHFPEGMPTYRISSSGIWPEQLEGIPPAQREWSGNVFIFPQCDRAPPGKMAAVIALQQRRLAELKSRQEAAMQATQRRRHGGP